MKFLLVSLSFILILAYGILLRYFSMTSRGLEYDEIWTLRHYALADHVTAIFNELSIPNNHVLHSLLVRI
ncbi:MAG: hypothetical protein HYS07_02490 [Chlamydiae bacterium]|nr:hypothetical protein [Chlamydiota bacterium]